MRRLWPLLFGLDLVVNQPTLAHNKQQNVDPSRTIPETLVPPQLACPLGVLSLGAENDSTSPPSIMAQPRGLLGRPLLLTPADWFCFVVLLLSLLGWLVMGFFVQRFHRDHIYSRPVRRPMPVAAG